MCLFIYVEMVIAKFLINLCGMDCCCRFLSFVNACDAPSCSVIDGMILVSRRIKYG